jgi:GAF domain-containing protein
VYSPPYSQVAAAPIALRVEYPLLVRRPSQPRNVQREVSAKDTHWQWGEMMEMELRLDWAPQDTGAVDTAGGTEWLRPQSAASHGLPILLDLRAGSDEASLHLLAQAAASFLSDAAGCAIDCAVTLAGPQQEPLTTGTSPSAAGLVEADHSGGDGPVAHALAGQVAAIVNSYSADPRWPSYSRSLTDAGFRSALSVPLPLGAESMAAITAFAREDNVFTPRVIVAATAFSKQAAASYLAAAELRVAGTAAEELRSEMKDRTSIEVACGIIMGRNRCSYQEALSILRQSSRHKSGETRDAAENLLKKMPGGPPSTHFKG